MNYSSEELDKIIDLENVSNNFIHKVNDCYLTLNEIEILKKYNINYSSCRDNKELLYLIEQFLQVNESNELEWLSNSLYERNYYIYTNK